MVKESDLPKVKTEEETQYLVRMGTILETHCNRCYSNQKRYKTYPYENKLAGEVLDVATNLLSGYRIYRFERGKELVKYFLRNCNENNCEEGTKVAKDISDLCVEIYERNLEDKEENY